MFVLLANNIMHSPLPLHRLSWDQIWSSSTEGREGGDWNKGWTVWASIEAHIPSFAGGMELWLRDGHLTSGRRVWCSCSPTPRPQRWMQPRQQIVVDSGNYSSQQSKPEAGGLQCCWWKRVSSMSPWWWGKASFAPEVFDTDDPVNYTNWREQFLNWLTFCDGRFADLREDVEQLGTMTKMSTLETPVEELATTKLYSILSSQLPGPALQVVRANGDQQNRLAVWHRLKQLYAPRARPRALAMHWPLVRPLCSIPVFLYRDPCWIICYSSMRCWISMSWQLVIPCQMTWQSELFCAARMDPRGDTFRWSWMKGWTTQNSRKGWSCWTRTKKRGLVTTSWRICWPSTSLRPEVLPATRSRPYGSGSGSGKRKNKSKGKQRGKRGSLFGLPYGGKYSGNQKGGGKGKPKHKGKKRNKGKNKGKQQKGKGYGGENSSNTCCLCGGYSH